MDFGFSNVYYKAQTDATGSRKQFMTYNLRQKAVQATRLAAEIGSGRPACSRKQFMTYNLRQKAGYVAHLAAGSSMTPNFVGESDL